jgi:hypothetical protein
MSALLLNFIRRFTIGVHYATSLAMKPVTSSCDVMAPPGICRHVLAW